MGISGIFQPAMLVYQRVGLLLPCSWGDPDVSSSPQAAWRLLRCSLELSFFVGEQKHVQKRTEISIHGLVCRHPFFPCLVISSCLQDARCEGDTKHENVERMWDLDPNWGGMNSPEAFPSGGCGWRWAVPDILGSFVVVVDVVKLWNFFEIINHLFGEKSPKFCCGFHDMGWFFHDQYECHESNL